jgi:hypothetical protein
MTRAHDLIEATPAGPIQLARLNRSTHVIEGTVLIGPQSSNGAHKKRRYSEAALKQIAAMAEGLPAYANHVAPELALDPRTCGISSGGTGTSATTRRPGR